MLSIMVNPFLENLQGSICFIAVGCLDGWLEECKKLTLLQQNCKTETTGAKKREPTETIRHDLREQVVNLLSNMILSSA